MKDFSLLLNPVVLYGIVTILGIIACLKGKAFSQIFLGLILLAMSITIYVESWWWYIVYFFSGIIWVDYEEEEGRYPFSFWVAFLLVPVVLWIGSPILAGLFVSVCVWWFLFVL